VRAARSAALTKTTRVQAIENRCNVWARCAHILEAQILHQWQERYAPLPLVWVSIAVFTNSLLLTASTLP
jgi:hypothetical protein